MISEPGARDSSLSVIGHGGVDTKPEITLTTSRRQLNNVIVAAAIAREIA
jgi:hypothetical protein